MAEKKTTLSVVVPQDVPAVNGSKKHNRKRAPKKPAPTLFTLQDAFSPMLEQSQLLSDNFDLERGLRAIAFLMHDLSEIGNREVDGYMIHGLATILDNYADQLGARAGRNELPGRAAV